MRNKVTSFLVILLIVLVIFSEMSVLEARKHHGKKGKKHHKEHHHKKKKHPGEDPGNGSPPTPPPTNDPFPTTSTKNFNLLSFGAVGDGVSDDSEIDGTILAPAKVWSGPTDVMYQWINLKWVQNFTIRGSGTVDGQGCEWWNLASSSHRHLDELDSMKKSNSRPEAIPTALRFFESYNVTVRDITIKNSPNCHLKFDKSGGVKVHDLTISAPEDSKNTDGIHLQNTQDVEIHHSDIACGDDCVSIQTGCSNVHIHDINCGPGHGISLGGLGKDGSVACVSNILVEKVSMTDTLYGARIKTWQGGLGAVKNVTFSNIQVSGVKVPVIIDQYYCDKHSCQNHTEAVAITGVTFDQITGTYTSQPLHLACSKSVPCSDVTLSDIDLTPSPGVLSGKIRQPFCWNSFGTSEGPLVPQGIDYCLKKGSSSLQKIAKSHDKNYCEQAS
ncbi:OLC1v1028353C2 [Oldenlandia corymbosa var. corymbosa]|uniref:OLC1v1028353C2 n=1 Tax=Oldenlandia corymbosa var. corymbosa TaxID=529605 RepID=A0AAV1CED1_OLDCO|nr:OLC1v1028353C2 [Oldenlandia corymbosa var. corymbosa]